MKKSIAFTLLELLIVLGITATLSVVSVGFYINQQKAKILENTTQEIANYLHYTQQKSMAQEQGLQWGVHFDNPATSSDFYGLYSNTPYATTTETKYLPTGIEFQTPVPSSSTDVSFKKMTGFLSGSSYQEIILKDSTGLTQNIIICYQGTISYNVDIGVCGEIGGIDNTPPIVNNVTASNTSYGSSYVDSPFDLSADINETQGGVTSCEYTINGGTNWYTANLAGTGPNYSCTKTSITSSDGTALTLNIRATSKGGIGYSSSITRTVDAVAPTCSDNWTDNWIATSPANITITTSNETGSGVASTKYCVDTPNTCSPSTSYTASVAVSCASGSVCTQYVRYAAWDNVNNASSIYSKRIRQDLQVPTATDNWTDDWTTTSPVTVTITPSDGSGSGIQSTYYCVSTADTCTPTTVGTSASVTCASGSVCTQYVRYYTKDNVNNISSTYSRRVRQDLQVPTATDNWTDDWTTTSPVTVTITPSDGSGSGIQTTYYCVDTVNTCTPTTVGTSASVTCASGSTCTQYVRYYTKDNANNISSTYSKRVRQDKQVPTDGILTATPSAGQVSLSWTTASDSGSGLATSNPYKLVYSTSSSPAVTCTSGTQIYIGTSTSYLHTGLTNGTVYYYRVCAYDNLNNISNGATSSGTPTTTTTTTTTTVPPCSCGSWSSCGSCSYATCACSGSGTQTRTCTPSGCDVQSQSCTCTRTCPISTVCNTIYGEWGACGSCSYGSVCACSGSGYEERSEDIYTCNGSGSCVFNVTTSEGRACTCTRTCPTGICQTGSCNCSCSYGSTCVNTGTCSGCTQQDLKCASGACDEVYNHSCTCPSGYCNRNTNGTLCCTKGSVGCVQESLYCCGGSCSCT